MQVRVPGVQVRVPGVVRASSGFRKASESESESSRLLFEPRTDDAPRLSSG
jgi:hypothetical protein